MGRDSWKDDYGASSKWHHPGTAWPPKPPPAEKQRWEKDWQSERWESKPKLKEIGSKEHATENASTSYRTSWQEERTSSPWHRPHTSEEPAGDKNDSWATANAPWRKKEQDEGHPKLNSSGLPIRPGVKECAFYAKTGKCDYGETCKWHHPESGADSSASSSAWPAARAEEWWSKSSSGPARPAARAEEGRSAERWESRASERSWQEPDRWSSHSSPQERSSKPPWSRDPAEDTSAAHSLPLRPDAKDCEYYMKTGRCKFGSNCKYNHPVDRYGQEAVEEHGEEQQDEVTGAEQQDPEEQQDTEREVGARVSDEDEDAEVVQRRRGEEVEPEWQERQQPWISSHGDMKNAPQEEEPVLNSMGLPIRPGVKDCGFYMKTWRCKFGATCRWNHPEESSRKRKHEPQEDDEPQEDGVTASVSAEDGEDKKNWMAPRPKSANSRAARDRALDGEGSQKRTADQPHKQPEEGSPEEQFERQSPDLQLEEEEPLEEEQASLDQDEEQHGASISKPRRGTDASPALGGAFDGATPKAQPSHPRSRRPLTAPTSDQLPERTQAVTGTGDMRPAAAREAANCSVSLAGLPEDCTEEMIVELHDKIGLNPRACLSITLSTSGRSSSKVCMALLRYRDAASARTAAGALDKQSLPGTGGVNLEVSATLHHIMTGIVKLWDPAEFYGVLEADDGGEEIFLDTYGLRDGTALPLEEGTRVCFEKRWNEDKGDYEAVDCHEEQTAQDVALVHVATSEDSAAAEGCEAASASMQTHTAEKAAVYLKNLSRDVKEDSLRELCSPYGVVKQVKLLPEYKGTRSALVSFASMPEAESCIEALHDSTPPGSKWKIVARFSETKTAEVQRNSIETGRTGKSESESKSVLDNKRDRETDSATAGPYKRLRLPATLRPVSPSTAPTTSTGHQARS